MQFNLALLSVVIGFFAVPGALAAPAPDNEAIAARKEDAAQVDGYVYACTNAGFSGNCENIGYSNNQCVTFSSAFQDDISSISPPSGALCYLYVDYYCKTDEAAFSVVSPGISDLSTTPYNDALSSMECYPA